MLNTQTKNLLEQMLDYLKRESDECNEISKEIKEEFKQLALEFVRGRFPNTKFLDSDVRIFLHHTFGYKLEISIAFTTINGCYFYGNDVWSEESQGEYRAVEPPIDADELCDFIKQFPDYFPENYVSCWLDIYR